MTLTDIICNALDKQYSLEQAATDLDELITERDLIKRRYGADTARVHELEQLIPIRETLALGKLRGDAVFDRLDLLNIQLEKA
jgi:hypothetical protein